MQYCYTHTFPHLRTHLHLLLDFILVDEVSVEDVLLSTSLLLLKLLALFGLLFTDHLGFFFQLLLLLPRPRDLLVQGGFHFKNLSFLNVCFDTARAKLVVEAVTGVCKLIYKFFFGLWHTEELFAHIVDHIVLFSSSVVRLMCGSIMQMLSKIVLEWVFWFLSLNLMKYFLLSVLLGDSFQMQSSFLLQSFFQLLSLFDLLLNFLPFL